MRWLPWAFMAALMSACALPMSFTTKKIMKVHQGMRSQEILKMFGNPRSVSQAVCGAATGHTWTCTTWEYGDNGKASFTFRGDRPDSLILNDFKIDRD